jgi:ankyrin repeat protein
MCCPAEIVKLLLDKNASIDIQDPFGRKPTHIACYNSLEALTLLKAPDSEFAVRDELG